MIGWLSGIVLSKRPPSLLLNVNGVGYELDAPMSTFAQLPSIGESVALHVHHVVREDAQLLFGFSHVRERDTFRALLRVNGVGAKVALAILSTLESDALARAVHDGDVSTLTRVPGIGKKTAERLVVEMRDRLNDDNDTLRLATTAGETEQASDPVAEAVSALIALGLKPPEASRRVASIAEEGLAAEEMVRQALKAMAL